MAITQPEDILTRGWFNVGPASQTVAQHYINIGLMSDGTHHFLITYVASAESGSIPVTTGFGL